MITGDDITALKEAEFNQRYVEVCNLVMKENDLSAFSFVPGVNFMTTPVEETAKIIGDSLVKLNDGGFEIVND